jgi:hypothetical protein
MTERRRSSFIALRPHRAVALERGCSLGIHKRESVAADMNFTILTCRCVVAQDDRGTVTGVGCCTDEHADMLRGFLTPGTFRSRHRRSFSFSIRTH